MTTSMEMALLQVLRVALYFMCMHTKTMVQSVQMAGNSTTTLFGGVCPPPPDSDVSLAPLSMMSLAELPRVVWRDAVVITPLTRPLRDFFSATRLVTWDHDSVDASFHHQEAGSRLLFALWIPENDWLASLTKYETKHSKGQGKLYAIDDEEWIACDLRSMCPSILVPTICADGVQVAYRPVATIATDFDNLTYDLHKDFGGNEANMRAWCACRETQVACICLLMVLPPFQGHGYARDLMDFAEEWVLRRGWTCEDAVALDFQGGLQQRIAAMASSTNPLPIPRRLPPCQSIALTTEASNRKNNGFYQRRGYLKTQVVPQDGWTAQFYLKRLD